MDPLTERYPALAARDEARRSLNWLLSRLSQTKIDEDWSEAAQRMAALNVRQNVVRVLTLEHDFWICKRPNPEPIPKNWSLPIAPDFRAWNAQRWEPPESWRAWPTFSVETDDWLSGLNPRKTRYACDATTPAWTGNLYTERASAVRIQKALSAEATDTLASVIGTQAACWLDVALGRVGRFFSNDVTDIDPDILLNDLCRNVIAYRSDGELNAWLSQYDVAFFADPLQLRPDMMEDCLDRLYSAVIKPDRSALDYQRSFRGQSSEWREYFRVLGAEISCDQALASVQLAALLLRSDSVWRALTELRSTAAADTGARDLVTCVRRRWYMALKCLAWLESSLQREEPFRWVTPADLACFAVTALLPTYPRARLAISHRGCDLKPLLVKSRLWGANEILIDARFRPEWQTNRAMVWSLFSATPLICKIKSANYYQSEWCRREAEMFDHLLDCVDFFDGRRYVEVEHTEIIALEPAAHSWSDASRLLDKPLGLDSPPFELRCWPAWQGALIRAGSAARFIYHLLLLNLEIPKNQCAEYAARLISDLHDKAATFEDISLFGIDHFWQRLSDELRSDAEVLGLIGPLATIRLDAASGAAEAENWFERLGVTVDVSSNYCGDVCDLLAALDWRQVLESYLRSHTQNGMFENQAGFIYLRGVSFDEWRKHPGWTVARGLLNLRLPYPLLVRQLADQGVEKWPGPCDVDCPIYTQHIKEQTVPHSEVFFALRGPWPGLYSEAIGADVQLCPQIAHACVESLQEGSDPVFMRFDRRDNDFDNWLIAKQREELPPKLK